MYFYVAYGLSIRSTIPLPELQAARPSDGEVDLVIAPLPEAPRLPSTGGVGLLVGHADGEVILHWSYFGTYRVWQGRRIEYAPASGLSDKAVRVPVLGVCMGILMHQRGLLTLHASAVAVNGGAIAFIGEKGAGKSTTTAALVKRGHGFLSDDVVALTEGTPVSAGSSTDEPAEGPWVLPGPIAIKLWPDSVAAVGIDPGEVPLLHEGVEKRVVLAPERSNPHALPLRCVYVLESGETVNSAPVQAHEAFSELVRHTYAARFLGAAAGGAHHFRQCTKLLHRVPLRRLVRARDVGHLDRLTAHVEEAWGP